jgi:flagellar motor switch protein FliN/FliY
MSETAQEEHVGTDNWGSAMKELDMPQSMSPVPAGTSATQIFQQFAADDAKTVQRTDLDMILDIPVQLEVQLGRTKIAIKSLLQLAQGSVIELDGIAGEPMDVLVNGCMIAQGEVVVVNGKFGIRLTDVITPSERMRKLNR